MKKDDFYPLVSVIIPVYNGANYLKEAIDSALFQTYKNVEIIVVNDGSTDKTEEIIKSYGNKLKYYKKENGGVASALNFAIKKAKGEYISWLSHDDTYFPNKIEKQIDKLQKQKNKLKIIYSDFIEVDENNKLLRKVVLPLRSSSYMSVFLAIECNLYLHGCSLLIPKKLFYLYGFFNTKNNCAQDYEMWFLFSNKVEFIHIKEILICTRIHKNQDSFVKADLKKIESDTFRSNAINQLKDENFKNYSTKKINFYREFYFLYKNAGYVLTPAAIINKIRNVFGKNIEISIIVPVFNVEKYLKKCLDSLIEQTFLNLEIIIINDGSTDQSIKIINKYLALYGQFIKVINKKNHGLGMARNDGLKMVSGQYVGYVDSDDYVCPTMYEDMYRLIRKGFEVVMCEFYKFDSKTENIISRYEFPKTIEKQDKISIIKQSTLKIAPCAWNKLYIKDLLNKAQFGPYFFEDIQATPVFISYAKKIGFIRKPLYFYRVNRKNSIIDLALRKQRKISYIFIESWTSLLANINKIYLHEARYAVYVHLLDIAQIFSEEIDDLKNFAVKNSNYFLKNKYIIQDIKDNKIEDIIHKKLIPKKIHYIWFGKKHFSDLNKKCINSWKKYAKNYEIIKWDESNCNIFENKYVQHAYKNKKWAFVADYFRFKIINENGGFYIDTDVELHKPIDSLRMKESFFGFEKKDIVNPCFFGALPKSRILTDMLNTYKNSNNQDFNQTAPQRLSNILIKDYGLKTTGKYQLLKNNIQIYPINLLTLNIFDEQNIAEHHFEYSWKDDSEIVTIPYKYYILSEFFKNKFLEENTFIGNIKSISNIKPKKNSFHFLNEKQLLDRLYVQPIYGHVLVRSYLRTKKIINFLKQNV